MEDLSNKKILLIVESPNQQKTISAILSNRGYDQIKVVASIGNIVTIGDDQKSFNNSGIFPEDDFRTNFTVYEDKRQLVYRLKEQSRDFDLVYIVSEPDTNSNMLTWSLVKFLELEPTKYRVTTLKEITPESIIYALEHPECLKNNLVQSAQSRMIVDKLIGYSLSPITKNYIGAKSVSRLSSAGLQMICEREKEIQDFQSDEYIDLALKFSHKGTEFCAKYIGTDSEAVEHLKTKEQVELIKNDCFDDYTVKKVTKEIVKINPEPPFCTASLLAEISGELGVGVKDIMNAIKKLYDGVKVGDDYTGLITYYKTNSTKISKEFVPTLSDFVDKNFNTSTPPTSSVTELNVSGYEEECIRCTDLNITPEMVSKYLKNNLIASIYTAIWKRTVASSLPPMALEKKTYYIKNNLHIFSLEDITVIEQGFNILYNNEMNTAPLGANVGDVITNFELVPEFLKTSPPKRFTEGTLVENLYKDGIGKPSTLVNIIETVLSPTRGYCILSNKYITPTDRGIQLSSYLIRAFKHITDLEFVRATECAFDLIAAGKLDKLEFLNHFFLDLNESLRDNKEGLIEKEEKFCPNCGAKMVVRRSRFGKLFYGCTRYPNCKGIISID